MAGPDWFRWVLAAFFLATAAYCIARLVAACRVPTRYRDCHRTVDIAQCVMSAGMAVMCSPVGGPLAVASWQTVYLVTTVWFLGAWYRRRSAAAVTTPIGWHGSDLHHAAAALAMLYMLSAMPSGHHTSGPWMPGMHDVELALPLIAWAFAGYFLVHATVLGPLVIRPPRSPDTQMPAILAATRPAASCQIVMALGATYMLVA